MHAYLNAHMYAFGTMLTCGSGISGLSLHLEGPAYVLEALRQDVK